MKRRIRLTEGDLRRIVNKSVRRALNENNYPFDLNRYKQLAQQGYDHIVAALDILSRAQEMTRSKEDYMKGSTYHLDKISKVVYDLLGAQIAMEGLGAQRYQ